MNQHIPDLQKALRHYAKQIEFALKTLRLTYQTFWEQTNLAKAGEYSKMYMDCYIKTPDNQTRPPFKQEYYEVLYEGNYLNLPDDKYKHLSGLLGVLGIDTSNGFKDWHNVYLEIVFGEKGEYERYLSNPNTYSFDYQSILKKDTPSVMQSDIQYTEIESIKKARIHFAKQLKTFLDTGCTYIDFWNSNLAEDIGLCYSKMWDLYRTNDYSNEKVKAMFILYGIDERSEDEKKSITFKVEIPAFQRIGIDCSNGFQEWHKKYCELAEREWNQYSSNLENYSFDFSIFKNNPPSVSELEKSKTMIPLTQPKKILFFGANPSNTGKLNLEKEYAKIAQQLEAEGARNRLELKSEFYTDLKSFQEKINNSRPNIIHFSGHGSDSNGELETFSRGILMPIERKNTGLIFHESGYGDAVLISDDTLDYNFKTFIEVDKIPIEVIVLNACYSTNQAMVLSKRVKYVVGVNNSIADEASIDFSAGFYYGLAEGKPVESAFRDGTGRAMPKMTDKNQIVLFVDGVKSEL